MAAEDYIAMASSPKMLGDPDVQSQHFLGSADVQKLSPTTASAEYQLRAAHLRLTKSPRKEVARAHAHGVIQFFYENTTTGWKISGIKGWADFMEGDILAVFPSWAGKGNVSWAY